MTYQLSGADRDAISGFVHSEQAPAAVAYVEKLVQRELEAANVKSASGLLGSPVQNPVGGLLQGVSGSHPSQQDPPRLQSSTQSESAT